MYVIKIGGALDSQLLHVCADVQTLTQRGEPVVLVHGGSAEANRLGEQLGQAPRFLVSPTGMRSRYTDSATLDVLTMALAGRVKPMIMAQLGRLSVRAVGLTGLDSALISAVKTPPVKAMLDGRRCVVRDDLSGRITSVNAPLLHLLLDAGYVPVISPPVLDPDFGPLNIDADRLAAAIAIALQATHLVILSNVPGLLRDPADPASLIPCVRSSDVMQYLDVARERMRVKLLAANEALCAGVAQVMLGDGRISSPVLAALAGRGTSLKADIVGKELPA